MVPALAGYTCALELSGRQMCTPTLGVAAAGLVLSGFALLLQVRRWLA